MKHGVFPMICGPGESKSRLAKAAGAEASGRVRNEKAHAAVPRSTFPKCTKHTFGISDVEELYAVVARSTFP